VDKVHKIDLMRICKALKSLWSYYSLQKKLSIHTIFMEAKNLIISLMTSLWWRIQEILKITIYFMWHLS